MFNERILMKKIVLSIVFAIFFSSAFAGSCLIMAKNIDAKIEEDEKLHDAGSKPIQMVIMQSQKNYLLKHFSYLKAKLVKGGLETECSLKIR